MFGYIDNFHSANIQNVYIRALVKQMGMTRFMGLLIMVVINS
jgi:hypothetical protein